MKFEEEQEKTELMKMESFHQLRFFIFSDASHPSA